MNFSQNINVLSYLLLNTIGAAEGVDKSKIERKEKKEGESDEFDMFAQSRNATYDTTKNKYSIFLLYI